MPAARNQLRIAFETLIDCCINKVEDKSILLSQVYQLIEKDEDILFELLEFNAIRNINFFVNVGIADGFGPNEWIESESKLVLQDQFPDFEIQFPESKDYEYTKWVSLPILKDYDKYLRQQQLQLSYIDNPHYDFLGVIHKIGHKEKLFKVFQSIGYDCFEIRWSNDPKEPTIDESL